MIQNDIDWIKNNWDKIPDKHKVSLKPSGYSANIKGIENVDKHFVVLLVDRQKPSVEACYDFDMERIGVNRDGKVIWGFDSGCSCPSPWVDHYDEDAYNVSKTWKEFTVNLEQFDKGIIEECEKTISEIKKEIKK